MIPKGKVKCRDGEFDLVRVSVLRLNSLDDAGSTRVAHPVVWMSYKGYVRAYLVPFIGKKSFAQLNAQVIEQFIGWARKKKLKGKIGIEQVHQQVPGADAHDLQACRHRAEVRRRLRPVPGVREAQGT